MNGVVLDSVKDRHREALRALRRAETRADIMRAEADGIEDEARALVVRLAQVIHQTEPDYLVDMETL